MLNKKKIIILILSILIVFSTTFTVVTYITMSDELEKVNEKLDDNKDELDKVKKENSILTKSISVYEKNNKKLTNENTDLLNDNKELSDYLDNILTIPGWSPEDVTSSSGVNEVGLTNALDETGLTGLESSFIEAEEEYGINAIFLTSLVALESNWGKSQRAIEQNNLTGYAVYEDHSEGKTFSSKHESIMATAKLLKKHYVGEGRYDIYSINSKYSVSPTWASKIVTIANEIISDADLNNHIEL